MRAWGFDYESLRAVKPDLIMLSTCLMGQTGPLARFAGFGNLAAALCGFYNLSDGPTARRRDPYSAYTDYIAPRFGLAAVMAALIHRKRTGQGQYIDQAQAESALQFLALPILDTVASGREYSPIANDDLRACAARHLSRRRRRSLGRNRMPYRRPLERPVYHYWPAAIG